MADAKTNNKKPLELAIQRQQLVNAMLKADKKLSDVQNVVKAIGDTVPSPKTTPAS